MPPPSDPKVTLRWSPRLIARWRTSTIASQLCQASTLRGVNPEPLPLVRRKSDIRAEGTPGVVQAGVAEVHPDTLKSRTVGPVHRSKRLEVVQNLRHDSTDSTLLTLTLGGLFFGLALAIYANKAHMVIFVVMVWMHATHQWQATTLSASSLQGCKSLVTEVQSHTDSRGVVYGCRKGWVE